MRTSIALAALLVAALLLLAPSHAVADTVLSIQPASSAVTQGGAFAVGVNISGVTDLYDFQFDLTFDPAVLQSTNVLEGTFLSGGGSTFFIPGTIDNTTGNITFNADTLMTAISGVSGDGTLVLFDFTALAPGTSTFTISNVILQDSSGTILDGTATGGSVAVSAVPEPSGLMLLGAGLLVLAGLTLKKTIL